METQNVPFATQPPSLHPMHSDVGMALWDYIVQFPRPAASQAIKVFIEDWSLQLQNDGYEDLCDGFCEAAEAIGNAIEDHEEAVENNVRPAAMQEVNRG